MEKNIFWWRDIFNEIIYKIRRIYLKTNEILSWRFLLMFLERLEVMSCKKIFKVVRNELSKRYWKTKLRKNNNCTRTAFFSEGILGMWKAVELNTTFIFVLTLHFIYLPKLYQSKNFIFTTNNVFYKTTSHFVFWKDILFGRKLVACR